MPSPTCQVKDGSGSYASTTDGVDVTPGNTITINLVSSAGVSTWSISCITTDELSDAAAVTSALVIDQVAKTATFTAPVAGRAYRFQSQINSGISVDGTAQSSYTTTFGIYTLTSSGLRVHALDETFESDSVFGWVTSVNEAIRSAQSTPTGTGFRHITSGTEDGTAQKVNLTATADVTAPSGTGFFHITSGSPDAASKLVVNADVDAAAAIAVTKIAPSSTNENVLKTSGGVPVWGTVNIASSNAVTGILPTANGGTGQNFGASSGIVKLASGTASVVTAPSGDIVGDTDSQTLTNKTLTSPTLSSPTLSGTITITGTSMQATGNARARVYSDISNVQTTDATVTTLFSWTVLDEACTKVCAEVCADQSSGANTAAYVRQVKYKGDGAAVTIGTVDTPFTSEDSAAWDCTLDNSGTTGRVRVTGAGGATIDWGGITTRLEVSHA